MADFRKSLLLAAMTLVVGVGAASAQTGTPICTGTTGAPPTLRSEGVTELVGTIVLNCSNIPNTTVNFDVSLNNGTVPITSRTDEVTVAVTNNGATTTYSGSRISTNGGSFTNVVRVTGIEITAAGDATTSNPVITISGIRARVNPTYVPLNTGGFGQVLALISVSNGILPIQQVGNGFFVGIVLPGLGTVSSAGSATISACAGTPISGSFTVSIPENFPTAFKVQNPVSPTSPDSETGPNLPLPQFNATTGTELAISFGNIPSGVTFSIPTTITSDGGGVAVLLVQEGDPTPYTAASSVTVAAGTTYYYNVVTANSGATETYSVPVTPTGTISTTSGVPTVSVQLAPVDGHDVPLGADTVPLFISLGGAGSLPVITVTPCQTTLLFPFMTNTAGFDTGFSVAATGTDPFENAAPGGTCTMYMYGTGAPTTAPTVTVPTAGEGHGLVSAIAPGFQGYTIAVCDFQYAHGFAFITDGFGGPGRGLAEGYLALVIDTSRPGASTAIGNGTTAESLGN